jgi:hypothetical protein
MLNRKEEEVDKAMRIDYHVGVRKHTRILSLPSP